MNMKHILAMNGARFLQIWAGCGPVKGPCPPPGDDSASASLLGNLIRSRGIVLETQWDLRLAHFAARWAALGYPLFSLTHSLEAALLLTDCTDVDGRDFAWPFDSFMVELPFPGAMSYLGADGTSVVPARYIVAHKTRHDASGGMIEALKTTVALAGRAATGPRGSFGEYFLEAGDALRRAEAAAVWKTGTFVALIGDGEAFVHAIGELPGPGGPVSPWVEDARTSSDGGYAVSDRDAHALNATRRLVVNLCLYIAGLDPAPRARSARVASGIPAEVDIPPILLGTEVKLPREMRDAAKARVEQGRSDAHRDAWKLHSRLAVRGHWRNQPYGPRPEGKIRRQWIRPYWKGPQDAAMVGRTYVTRLAGEGKDAS
jgi:hypothetical protein